MNQIVKIFTGKHIDLSKIVAISDAYFINRSYDDGYFVGFDIECQLLEKPIHYERKLTTDEEGAYEFEHESHGVLRKYTIPVKLTDGSETNPNKLHTGQPDQEVLAVRNLQKQVDEIIQQWKDSKQPTEG